MVAVAVAGVVRMVMISDSMQLKAYDFWDGYTQGDHGPHSIENQ